MLGEKSPITSTIPCTLAKPEGEDPAIDAALGVLKSYEILNEELKRLKAVLNQLPADQQEKLKKVEKPKEEQNVNQNKSETPLVKNIEKIEKKLEKEDGGTSQLILELGFI